MYSSEYIGFIGFSGFSWRSPDRVASRLSKYNIQHKSPLCGYISRLAQIDLVHIIFTQMKFLYLLLVTATLLVSPVKFASPAKAQRVPQQAALETPEWQPFCSAMGQFAIDMPGSPNIKSQIFSNQIIAHTYRSRLKNKETYLLQYFDLDLRLNNNNINTKITLNTAVDLFVVAANAKLLQVRDISLGGYPGKEFEFQTLSPNEPVGVGQVFLVETRVYGLVATTPEPENAQKFLDSFRLF
jgi:hypothetical protein